MSAPPRPVFCPVFSANPPERQTSVLHRDAALCEQTTSPYLGPYRLGLERVAAQTLPSMQHGVASSLPMQPRERSGRRPRNTHTGSHYTVRATQAADPAIATAHRSVLGNSQSNCEAWTKSALWGSFTRDALASVQDNRCHCPR